MEPYRYVPVCTQGEVAIACLLIIKPRRCLVDVSFMTLDKEHTLVGDREEDEYHESEDEDFNPEKASDRESDDENADKEVPSYESIAGSGLVRTRAQRAADQQKAPEPVKIADSSVDIDALWAEMNAAPAPRPATAAGDKPAGLKEEEIEIERTFKFAGKVTTEKKTVLASSAEGREFLEQQKQAAQPETASPDDTAAPKPQKRRPGPVKRKSTLAEEYAAGRAKKLNTLDKSRLDWLGFVDHEGINADLKKHNKNGYLEKQGFLARVDFNMDRGIKQNRS